MDKDDFLSAVSHMHEQWQESRRAIGSTAGRDSGGEGPGTHDDWVIVHGQRTAKLCALLSEAYGARDDVTEDELGDAVALSPSELRAAYDGICSPQTSTT